MPSKVLITVSPIYRRAVWRLIDGLQQDGLEVRYLDRPDEQLGATELGELLVDAEIYVVGNAPVPRAVMEAAPGLKLISKFGVGVDNIDLTAAAELGIQVTNAPGANATAVAEMTLGVMLALLRRLSQIERSLREWGWRAIAGQELYGKTLGIIGLGNIGQQVATRARAFGMRVIANDIVEYPDFCRQHDVHPAGLDQTLAHSDVITLHVPLTPLTRRMIGPAELGRMKPGAVLIHTARGGVVDEAALHQALKGGGLGGAAVDVFENEPLGWSPLRELDNIILTPHIAGITYEAAERIADRTLESVRAFRSYSKKPSRPPGPAPKRDL